MLTSIIGPIKIKPRSYKIS